VSAEVRLFGPVSVVIGERRLGPRDFGGRKAKQVLEILALSQGRVVSKDQLTSALWNEDAPRDAHGCLEHYVSLLRRQLRVRGEPGSAIVLTEHRGYRLAAEGVWVDVAAFDALDGAWAGGEDRSLVEGALALMPGELLEDEPYADWALAARNHYGQRRLELVCRAGEMALQERDFDAALRWGRTGAAIDVMNEASHRCLMLAHYARGERAKALRVFADISRALVEELGVNATRATTALHIAILDEIPFDELLPARASALELTAAQLQSNARPTPHEIPHLGRHAQLETLQLACTHDPAGPRCGPIVVVIGGGSGLGKSRMLDEAAAGMPERDVQYVSCAPGMQHVRGALIEQIVTVLLGKHARSAAFVDAFSSAVQQDSVSLTAVCELERALAGGKTFVVMIDDAHWADEFSIRLLTYLIERDGGVSGAFVFALNDEELRPEHARLSRRATCRIHLEPLSEQDLEPLAIDDLHAATGGLPVAVVAHVQARAGLPAEIPDSYRSSVLARIHALGETAWRVAVASAITEPPCAPGEVSSLLGADPLDVVEMQDRLCSIGVLQPGADGFAFRYPLVRTLLRDTISPARLRLMGQVGARPAASREVRPSVRAATVTAGS